MAVTTKETTKGPAEVLPDAIKQAISGGFGALVEIRGMAERTINAKSSKTGMMEQKILHEYFAEKLGTGEQVRLTVWPDTSGRHPVEGLKKGDNVLAIIRSLKGNEASMIACIKVELA